MKKKLSLCFLVLLLVILGVLIWCFFVASKTPRSLLNLRTELVEASYENCFITEDTLSDDQILSEEIHILISSGDIVSGKTSIRMVDDRAEVLYQTDGILMGDYDRSNGDLHVLRRYKVNSFHQVQEEHYVFDPSTPSFYKHEYLLASEDSKMLELDVNQPIGTVEYSTIPCH